MITVLNLHSSIAKIPAKYRADVPTILEAVKTKLHEKDSEVNFVIEQFLKQINAEISTPKPKGKTTQVPAEPKAVKTKFKIGNSVQISNFGTEAKVLSFRLNRKKEIVYKCEYIAPINEIFEAKESELQLFKEYKPNKPKAESKPVVKSTNPTPFAIKPKSISVATAINDVLGLEKFKNTVKPLTANLLYKLFKNDLDNVIDLSSDYEIAILKKDSLLHTSFEGEELFLTKLGIDFVKAVNGRLDSLRNQKNNYAMFDGLAGAKKKSPVKKPLNGLIDGLIINALANQLSGTNKKKKTLKAPAIQVNNAPVGSLAHRLQNKHNVKHEYYTVPDKQVSDFLGKIEKKTKESVAITIAGGQGSMKTRFCFQLMNAFAQNYKVGHASIEEHPESALYEAKIHQYLNSKAIHNITAPEIESIADVHKLVQENDVIIIDSFSKLQEMDRNCQLDKDFRKAYNGKLFIIIYQLTGDGKMRGGAKSQFDGDCIAFIEKMPDYKENVVYWDKNRYNDKPELKFNIFSGKLKQEAQPTAAELKTKQEFSFSIE